MSITSKHINIYKFVKRNDENNLQDMAKAFDLTEGNLIVHLKKIYENIDSTGKYTKLEDMIEEIKIERKALYLLKQKQKFRKSEREEYIIFSLLTKKIIKLSDLEKELSISRRTLNYDLDKVKEKLKENKLIVESSNKGVTVKGSKEIFKHMIHLYIFKYLIEKPSLPKETRKLFSDYIILDKRIKLIKREIKHLNTIFSEKYSYYSYLSMYSLYILLEKSTCKGLKLKDIKSFEDFKNLVKINLSEEKLEKLFNQLKKGIFKNIPIEEIKFFSMIYNVSYGLLKKYSEDIRQKAFKIKKILEKNHNLKIVNCEEYINRISDWLIYCKAKEKFNIKDYYFTNIIYIPINKKMLKTLEEIRKIFHKFTIYDLYITYFKVKELSEKNKTNKKTIFLYKNIMNSITDIFMEEIKTKYKINCDEKVFFSDLNEYLKNNQVEKIITMENFNIERITTIKIPFPEFN